MWARSGRLLSNVAWITRGFLFFVFFLFTINTLGSTRSAVFSFQGDRLLRGSNAVGQQNKKIVPSLNSFLQKLIVLILSEFPYQSETPRWWTPVTLLLSLCQPLYQSLCQCQATSQLRNGGGGAASIRLCQQWGPITLEGLWYRRL